MNFDTFIDRYKDEIVTIHKELQLLSIPKDTLRQMLTDLYNEAYDDGISQKNVELHRVKD